ncbi:hypothetical protein LEN_3120 [Lysobacter enzymogenes]|uniref:Uncharacterized protein n=1 Tax=Lysobacter enzymogenes TaxID=69 RepID=A0AAU9AXI0_LYSEN|nr:hypothetical protein LEN_3120 [Lysobacter enzymogenes]
MGAVPGEGSVLGRACRASGLGALRASVGDLVRGGNRTSAKRAGPPGESVKA